MTPTKLPVHAQTIYPPNQQPRQARTACPTIRTVVSRRPAWQGGGGHQLVVLVRDASGSMAGHKAHQADQGSQDLVAELASPANRDAFFIAVIDFETTARVVHPPARASERLGALTPLAIGGATNLCHGLELAQQLIQEHRRTAAPSTHPPVVVIYSDGAFNEGGSPVPVAGQLKQQEALILSVAYGEDADLDTLRAIATSPEHCYARAASGNELRRFMAQVGRTLTMTLTQGRRASQTLRHL